MAGFQFAFGNGLSLGQRYYKTLGKERENDQPGTTERRKDFLSALVNDILLAQFAILLLPYILSSVSHNPAIGSGLRVLLLILRDVIPLGAMVWVVGRNLVTKKWYWAILNVSLFGYSTALRNIPASALAALHISSSAYAVEACTLPVIIVFLIGNWKRLLTGGLGCILSWVIWFNAAYDFLSISLLGFLPAYPVYGQSIKNPPYDFALISWTACGLEAVIIAIIAGVYIASEVSTGIAYVAIGTRPHTIKEADGQQKPEAKRGPQQQRNILPDILTFFKAQLRRLIRTLFNIVIKIGEFINFILYGDSLLALRHRRGASEEKRQELEKYAVKKKRDRGFVEKGVSKMKSIVKALEDDKISKDKGPESIDNVEEAIKGFVKGVENAVDAETEKIEKSQKNKKQ